MLQDDFILLRKMEEKDLPLKVKWINDPEVNKYLHYDLLVTLEKTKKWYKRIQLDNSRIDLVIETLDKKPIGFGGLLKINNRDKNAELFITIGEKSYWGKGYGILCVKLLLDYGFEKLDMDKIYVTTEKTNIGACKLYESMNFKKEGELRKQVYSLKDKKNVDLFFYGILRSEHYENK